MNLLFAYDGLGLLNELQMESHDGAQCLFFTCLVWALSVHQVAGEDLAEKYPASLADSNKRRGLSWSCEAKDVWRLTPFVFALDEKFRIELGPSQVVLGHHKNNVL